ncbi:hypothetical protein [Loktanella sp. R86503]|uniref:hypothetical protein n=1 Tax=Loktanella sp. R86503 TaxID=3093847 RepID=UPI0036D97836
MANTHEIITKLEEAAVEFGVKPSTIGEKIGQGGQFYARLLNGKRCWPETYAKVDLGLRLMRENGDINLPNGWSRDLSHGNAANGLQDASPKEGAK